MQRPSPAPLYQSQESSFSFPPWHICPVSSYHAAKICKNAKTATKNSPWQNNIFRQKRENIRSLGTTQENKMVHQTSRFYVAQFARFCLQIRIYTDSFIHFGGLHGLAKILSKHLQNQIQNMMNEMKKCFLVFLLMDTYSGTSCSCCPLKSKHVKCRQARLHKKWLLQSHWHWHDNKHVQKITVSTRLDWVHWIANSTPKLSWARESSKAQRPLWLPAFAEVWSWKRRNKILQVLFKQGNTVFHTILP